MTHTVLEDNLKLLFTISKTCYFFLLQRQSRCSQKQKKRQGRDARMRDGDPARSHETQEIRLEIISPFHHRRDQAAR